MRGTLLLALGGAATLLVAVLGLRTGADQPTTPTPEVGPILDRLLELKAKRQDIERQEREAIKELTQRLAEQQRRIAALGLRLDGGGWDRDRKDPNGPRESVPSPAPAPPVVVADEYQTAYDQDRAANLAGSVEVKALARLYTLAGEGLERARPATVGHFLAGLDVLVKAQLKQRAPALSSAARKFLTARLPASETTMTPQVTTAARLAALGVADALERLHP